MTMTKQAVAAREIILAEIEKLPAGKEDHWLLDRLSVTYYEQKKYAKSLELLERARAIAPSCPLVLWDLAGTLDMLGKKKEAIETYLHLLRQSDVTSQRCHLDFDEWADLLTDCCYRVGMCYADLGKKEAAIRCLIGHLGMREGGFNSIYTQQNVRDELRKLRGNGPVWVPKEMNEMVDDLQPA